MLESLRDFPYSVSELLFSQYKDGIVHGFSISATDSNIFTIGPGILKDEGKLYYSMTNKQIEQKEGVNYVYLSKELVETPDGKDNSVCIQQYNSEQTDKHELFRYTKNARISEFQNIEELFSIPINRINRIYSHNSIVGGSTLCKEYLNLYAQKILDLPQSQILDISFAHQCLNGINDINIIYAYFGLNKSNSDIVAEMEKKINELSQSTQKIDNTQVKPDAPKKMYIS